MILTRSSQYDSISRSDLSLINLSSLSRLCPAPGMDLDLDKAARSIIDLNPDPVPLQTFHYRTYVEDKIMFLDHYHDYGQSKI